VEAAIREADDEITRDIVKSWVGVPVHPVKETIPHGRFQKLRSKFRLSRKVLGWRRLWLAPVLEAFTEKYFELLVDGNPDWVDEQPGLQVSYKLHREFCYRPPKFSPPPPLVIPLPALGRTIVIPNPGRERLWTAREMDS
jgi:hypothetical protein